MSRTPTIPALNPIAASKMLNTADLERVPFEEAAATVLTNLQRGLSELLAAVPGDMSRAKDVERGFDIDARLGWQIHRIATAPNPLACGTNVPARVSVQKFLKAAAKRHIRPETITRVADAFEAFERFVEEQAGDRERLASMVGGLVREEADELDLKYKKSVYRGMCHLVGVDVRSQIHTSIVHAGRTPDTIDVALLRSFIGLHRLRASSPLVVPLGTLRFDSKDATPEKPYKETKIEPLPGMGENYLLHEYCSSRLEHMRIIGGGTPVPMLEVSEGVGLKNSATISTGSISRGSPTPYTGTDVMLLRFVPRVRIPSATLIGDVLVHREAFPIRHPMPNHVLVHGSDRISEPGYPKEADLLSVREHCEYRGQGLAQLGTPDAPSYVDMLRAVCGTCGWNSNEFHVYRCYVQFPILRSSIMIGFDVPVK